MWRGGQVEHRSARSAPLPLYSRLALSRISNERRPVMRTGRTTALVVVAALAAPLSLLLPLARGADQKKGDDLLKPAAPGITTPSADSVQLTPEQLKEAGEGATKAAEKLGWRVGSQAWSFNRGSFFQAVDQVQALGLHYIEAFPDQPVDQDKNVKMNAGQSAEVRSAI